MAEYSLYILRCADDSLYTGIARDVAARVAEHESGRQGAKYLRGRQPFELVFEQAVGDRAAAQRAEYRIKRLPRQAKLELVAGRLSFAAVVADYSSVS